MSHFFARCASQTKHSHVRIACASRAMLAHTAMRFSHGRVLFPVRFSNGRVLFDSCNVQKLTAFLLSPSGVPGCCSPGARPRRPPPDSKRPSGPPARPTAAPFGPARWSPGPQNRAALPPRIGTAPPRPTAGPSPASPQSTRRRLWRHPLAACAALLAPSPTLSMPLGPPPPLGTTPIHIAHALRARLCISSFRTA